MNAYKTIHFRFTGSRSVGKLSAPTTPEPIRASRSTTSDEPVAATGAISPGSPGGLPTGITRALNNSLGRMSKMNFDFITIDYPGNVEEINGELMNVTRPVIIMFNGQGTYDLRNELLNRLPVKGGYIYREKLMHRLGKTWEEIENLDVFKGISLSTAFYVISVVNCYGPMAKATPADFYRIPEITWEFIKNNPYDMTRTPPRQWAMNEVTKSLNDDDMNSEDGLFVAISDLISNKP